MLVDQFADGALNSTGGGLRFVRRLHTVGCLSAGRWLVIRGGKWRNDRRIDRSVRWRNQ